MIFIREIEVIENWVSENRPDQYIDKPYFDAIEVDGGYQLPEDKLILKGLDAMNLNYSIIRDINGVMVQVEFPSKHIARMD